MNVFEGKVVSEGMKVGIVAARFNEFIVANWWQAHRMHSSDTM